MLPNLKIENELLSSRTGTRTGTNLKGLKENECKLNKLSEEIQEMTI